MPFKLLDPGVTLRHVGERTLDGGRPADVLELTVAEALEAAREDSGPADGVLVFGSFLTADAALRALGGGA